MRTFSSLISTVSIHLSASQSVSQSVNIIIHIPIISCLRKTFNGSTKTPSRRWPFPAPGEIQAQSVSRNQVTCGPSTRTRSRCRYENCDPQGASRVQKWRCTKSTGNAVVISFSVVARLVLLRSRLHVQENVTLKRQQSPIDAMQKWCS